MFPWVFLFPCRDPVFTNGSSDIQNPRPRVFAALIRLDVQDKSLREIHELVSSAYQKVIPNQTTAIRICLFPERQHWKKETWDRIRFCDDLCDRLKRMLGMSSRN